MPSTGRTKNVGQSQPSESRPRFPNLNACLLWEACSGASDRRGICKFELRWQFWTRVGMGGAETLLVCGLCHTDKLSPPGSHPHTLTLTHTQIPRTWNSRDAINFRPKCAPSSLCHLLRKESVPTDFSRKKVNTGKTTKKKISQASHCPTALNSYPESALRWILIIWGHTFRLHLFRNYPYLKNRTTFVKPENCLETVWKLKVRMVHLILLDSRDDMFFQSTVQSPICFIRLLWGFN